MGGSLSLCYIAGVAVLDARDWRTGCARGMKMPGGNGKIYKAADRAVGTNLQFGMGACVRVKIFLVRMLRQWTIFLYRGVDRSCGVSADQHVRRGGQCRGQPHS